MFNTDTERFPWVELLDAEADWTINSLLDTESVL